MLELQTSAKLEGEFDVVDESKSAWSLKLAKLQGELRYGPTIDECFRLRR